MVSRPDGMNMRDKNWTIEEEEGEEEESGGLRIFKLGQVRGGR